MNKYLKSQWKILIIIMLFCEYNISSVDFVCWFAERITKYFGLWGNQTWITDHVMLRFLNKVTRYIVYLKHIMNSVLWRGCVGRFVLSCPASEGCVGRFVLSRPAIELVHSNQSVLKIYTRPTSVGHHQAVGRVRNVWAILMAVRRVSVETGYEEARRAVPKVCSCR